MQIGDLEVSAIYDGVGKFDAERFRGTTDEMWSQHQHFIDGDGKVELALGGFLIRGISRSPGAGGYGHGGAKAHVS